VHLNGLKTSRVLFSRSELNAMETSRLIDENLNEFTI